MSSVWNYVFFGAALYCALQASREFRRKDYFMAAMGAVLAVAIILRPVF